MHTHVLRVPAPSDDLQAMGFPSGDRVFAPERLPATEGLLPSIHRCVKSGACGHVQAL